MGAGSRPNRPSQEQLLLGEAVAVRLSDQVWHDAACQRAATQLILAKIAGMDRFGLTWVPQIQHRSTYEDGLGPGMAGLSRTPAQAVAIAVAGGQQAAHTVFTSALTEEEARAVSARWSRFDEQHQFGRDGLAEPWDWDHAVRDARALIAEPVVREEIELLAEDLARGGDLPHGDWDWTFLSQVRHRIWRP